MSFVMMVNPYKVACLLLILSQIYRNWREKNNSGHLIEQKMDLMQSYVIGRSSYDWCDVEVINGQNGHIYCRETIPLNKIHSY